MNELEQLCEIDGHEWIISYFEYGLVLGDRTVEITKWCNWCKAQETKTINYPKYKDSLDIVKIKV